MAIENQDARHRQARQAGKPPGISNCRLSLPILGETAGVEAKRKAETLLQPQKSAEDTKSKAEFEMRKAETLTQPRKDAKDAKGKAET